MKDLTRILANIEAIPETADNYRTLREAIRDIKQLIGKAVA